MKLGSLFLGVLATLFVVVLLPFGFAYLEWIPKLNGAAWYILLITASGLIIKIFVADSADSKFEFSKFGYDFCIIALGGILTSFAIQVVSDHDLFPGINNITFIKDIPPISKSATTNRSAQLLIAFLFALIFTFFAARISAAIKVAATNSEKGSPGLSFVNAILGAGLLGSYALMLISKG